MAFSTAVWTGNVSWAAAVLRSALAPPPAGNPHAPLAVQVWADGQLPAEEARTNSVGYVGMDLLGLLRLGVASRYPPLAAAGLPDVLTYTAPANRSSIAGAARYMVPFATGAARWPHANIGNATFAGYFEAYRRAAHAGWADADALGAVSGALVGGAAAGVNRSVAALLWPWPLVGV
jgi:hypothetical protein